MVAWWGRALSSFAFRTLTLSTDICIKMEECGEQGEGTEGFRKDRAGGLNRYKKKRRL